MWATKLSLTAWTAMRLCHVSLIGSLVLLPLVSPASRLDFEIPLKPRATRRILLVMENQSGYGRGAFAAFGNTLRFSLSQTATLKFIN